MYGITKPQTDPMLDLLYRLERRMGRMFNEPFGLFEWNVGAPLTATASRDRTRRTEARNTRGQTSPRHSTGTVHSAGYPRARRHDRRLA